MEAIWRRTEIITLPYFLILKGSEHTDGRPDRSFDIAVHFVELTKSKNINSMLTNIKFSVYKTSANLLQDATFPVTVCDAICEQYSFKK